MVIYKLIADYRSNLQRFNRFGYESCFSEYRSVVEAAVSGIDDIKADILNSLDALEADWASEKKRVDARIKHDNDKVFICCYLNPALYDIGTEKCLEVENTLKECWDNRFKRDAYELGTYDKIMAGFSPKLFGIKLSRD